jgi:hypothetical protein
VTSFPVRLNLAVLSAGKPSELVKSGTTVSGEADDCGQLLVGRYYFLPMLDLHMYMYMYSKVSLRPTWPRKRALDEF